MRCRFSIEDSGEAVTVDVALPRFLDSAAVDAKVEPTYVRVSAKKRRGAFEMCRRALVETARLTPRLGFPVAAGAPADPRGRLGGEHMARRSCSGRRSGAAYGFGTSSRFGPASSRYNDSGPGPGAYNA